VDGGPADTVAGDLGGNAYSRLYGFVAGADSPSEGELPVSFTDDVEAEQPAQSLGRLELGPDGGTFEGVKADAPITDWSVVFQRFNLDPTEFEVVDDTIRMSTWQQSKRLENGERDVINLYSYR